MTRPKQRKRHAERLLTHGEGAAVQAAIRVEPLAFTKAAGVTLTKKGPNNP